ncbi:OLC1v1007815C2 [Oldenlandia corymbosa var. corymbosa]|nr:OLC1v1007815C2 [Oldenlandia corymbosa var. corymbosa]
MAAGNGNEPTRHPKAEVAEEEKGCLKPLKPADSTKGPAGIWNANPENANATQSPGSDVSTPALESDTRSKLPEVISEVPAAAHQQGLDGQDKDGSKQYINQEPAEAGNLHPENVGQSNAIQSLGSDVSTPALESDDGSEFPKVIPEVPSATHQPGLDEHEEDAIKQHTNQGSERAPLEEEDMEAVRTLLSFREEERRRCLAADIKRLKRENLDLEIAALEECIKGLQLVEENRNLLDKLRKKLPPDVIARLEAQDPDREDLYVPVIPP